MTQGYRPGITEVLIRLAGRGEHRELSRVLSTVVVPSRARCVEVIDQLIRECARAIGARCDSAGEGEVFTVFFHDDEAASARIDNLSPGVRAAVRAVLAELNEEPFDRTVQVGLAAGGSRCELVQVIVQCLAWVTDLGEQGNLGSEPEVYCVTD